MRVGAGPHLRHDGHLGATVAGAMGVGGAVGDYRALYVDAVVVVLVDETTRAGGGAGLEYLAAGGALPWRVSGHAAIVGDQPRRPLVGAAVAIYPLHSNIRRRPPPKHGGEISWDGLFESLGQDLGTLGGLGLELGVDALPTGAPGTARELIVSLRLVGAVSTIEQREDHPD